MIQSDTHRYGEPLTFDMIALPVLCIPQVGVEGHRSGLDVAEHGEEGYILD